MRNKPQILHRSSEEYYVEFNPKQWLLEVPVQEQSYSAGSIGKVLNKAFERAGIRKRQKYIPMFRNAL